MGSGNNDAKAKEGEAARSRVEQKENELKQRMERVFAAERTVQEAEVNLEAQRSTMRDEERAR